MSSQDQTGSSRLSSPLSTLFLFTKQAAVYDTAIFDLDGVITATSEYHFAAWSSVAARLGFQLPLSANVQIKGATRQRSLEIVLNHGGLELPEIEKINLLEQTQSDYLKYIQTMGAGNLIPGIDRYIRQLREAGVKIGLGSSSRNATAILSQLGLINLFDVVVDGNAVHLSKPHPQVFLTAAELLGKSSKTCVVFEDSQAGLIAAKASGMLAIGVGEVEDFPQADLVIHNFVTLCGG